jgi:L-fuculose-phosphate aldolase
MSETSGNDATLEQLLDSLVLACRILGADGQGDMVWGHVSVRDPDGRGTWMKAAGARPGADGPTGLGLEEIERDDLVLLDRSGTVLAGDRRRHAEYPIHTELMAARSDVGCVVHTHAREPVALAAFDEPLRAISHEGTFFAPVGVPRFTETSDLILTPELGQRLAQALGDASAILMRGHGMAVVGTDVVEATMAAVLLRKAAAIQLEAMHVGQYFHYTSDAEALVKRGHVYPRPLLEQGFEYLARKVADPAR